MTKVLLKTNNKVLATDGKLIVGNSTPTGTLEITENGTHNVREYEEVNVNVAGSGGEFELENNTLTQIPANYLDASSKVKTFKSESATQILKNAFSGCIDLENVYLPNVTYVRSNALSNTGVKHLHFPKLNTLENYSFENCSDLKSIRFDTMSKITSGMYVFRYDYNLVDMYFGYDGVVSLWATSVFSGITKGLKVHVRPEYADQYTDATNWVSLIANGTIVIVGDYTE